MQGRGGKRSDILDDGRGEASLAIGVAPAANDWQWLAIETTPATFPARFEPGHQRRALIFKSEHSPTVYIYMITKAFAAHSYML